VSDFNQGHGLNWDHTERRELKQAVQKLGSMVDVVEFISTKLKENKISYLKGFGEMDTSKTVLG